MERKAQGAIEYILILSGIVFVVLLAIQLLQGSIFTPSANQTATSTATLSDFIKCMAGNDVQNPGFEQDSDKNGVPDYWTNTSGAVADRSGSHRQTGATAINVSGSGTFTSSQFNVSPNYDYVLTVYAKSPDAGQTTITLNTYWPDGRVALSRSIVVTPASEYAAYKTPEALYNPGNNANITITSNSGLVTMDNICVSKI
ncbi:MAG: hypothetical protein WC792_04890 [Candidatus Micrarchaeia archaeon]|jgi:hypothetical protein